METMLIQLLLNKRWSLDDAVAAGMVLIDSVIKQEGEYIENVAPQDTKVTDMETELVMSSIARRNPMFSLFRYITAAIISLIESRKGVPGVGKMAAATEDFVKFFRIYFATGKIYLRTMDAWVEPKKLFEVQWPRRDTPDLIRARQLLASHIRRKALLEAPDIEFGYHLFVASYSIIKFYAKASAAINDRVNLIPDDIRKGVQIVEYNLLLHRSFQGQPLEKTFVKSIFRKFLFHSSFTSSMVGF
ncbi:MAG: hypothetical protein JKX97_06220 [Candidatus Lindowbacteria bacterium]|nr:hypothetical protein [Candidatus Lindowbacteria bacterium]